MGECERHQRDVCDPQGFGRVDLESDDTLFRCPVCKDCFELKNIFFYQCSWTTEYQKKGACGKPCDPPKGTKTTALETVTGNSYKKFNDGDFIMYRRLMFLTQR